MTIKGRNNFLLLLFILFISCNNTESSDKKNTDSDLSKYELVKTGHNCQKDMF